MKGGSPYRESKAADPVVAWSAYEIDLWLRYKSKTVDLVWLKRTCKVSLRG